METVGETRKRLFVDLVFVFVQVDDVVGIVTALASWRMPSRLLFLLRGECGRCGYIRGYIGECAVVCWRSLER